MATVSVAPHHQLADTLVFTVNGCLLASEFLATKMVHYCDDDVPNGLWDFSQGTLQAISTREFKAVIRALSLSSRNRRGTNTVFVLPESTDYGIGRMYVTLAQVMDLQTEYAVCRDMAEAEAWLRKAFVIHKRPSSATRRSTVTP